MFTHTAYYPLRLRTLCYKRVLISHRLLSAGILLNVSGDDSDLKSGQVVTQVGRALTPDARDLACKVTSNAEAEDYELQVRLYCWRTG